MYKYKLLILTVISLALNLGYGQSLFERVDIDKAIDFNELKEIVKANAILKGKSHLSLGETHSQANTTHILALELIKTYKNAFSDKTPSKLCLEALPRFSGRTDYQELKKEFSLEEIYENNSPYTTDFKRCFAANINKYVTYSGLFHQYDYATSFPKELDNSTLAKKENNFINLQMKSSKGLYISQINLYILEVLANAKLFNDKVSDPIIFIDRVNKLINAREKIISTFNYIYTGTSVYNTKMGSVVPKDAIAGEKLPEDTFFVLTDLEYRLKDDTSFLLLKEIKKRSPKEISLFLKAINTMPTYLPASAASIEQENDQEIPKICYGKIPGFCFPFYAQFMEMKLKNSYHLFVALKNELKCFERKPSFTKINAKGEEELVVYPFIQKNCSEQILEYEKLPILDRQ